MVYENKVLMRIFGPKNDQLTRVCKKLIKADLNDLYFSPDNIRVIN